MPNQFCSHPLGKTDVWYHRHLLLFFSRYGFTKEILHKYKSHATRLTHLIENVYSWMPVASVIDDHIFVTHGGISDITDLRKINQIQRNKVC
jgi:serine/threonine-protein phosphatase with EF-hands